MHGQRGFHLDSADFISLALQKRAHGRWIYRDPAGDQDLWRLPALGPAQPTLKRPRQAFFGLPESQLSGAFISRLLARKNEGVTKWWAHKDSNLGPAD
jgi:hypothetical protein